MTDHSPLRGVPTIEGGAEPAPAYARLNDVYGELLEHVDAITEHVNALEAAHGPVLVAVLRDRAEPLHRLVQAVGGLSNAIAREQGRVLDQLALCRERIDDEARRRIIGDAHGGLTPVGPVHD